MLLLLCAGVAVAGTVKNYSADMVDAASGRVVSKIYASDKKLRMDMFDESGKKVASSIVLMDQKKMYALQDESKTYMEFALKDDAMPALQGMANAFLGDKVDVKREKVGSETVSGYKADKYKTITTINLGGKKEMISYSWIAPEFDMPVRMQDGKGSIQEMRNIKKETQPASLFEIPKGYEKDTSMEEMSKLMKGKGMPNMPGAGRSVPQNAPQPKTPTSDDVTKSLQDSALDSMTDGVKSITEGLINKLR